MTVSHTSKPLQDMPVTHQQDPLAAQLIVYNLTTINLALAFNFFPLVPLLGWYNFGHANWALSLIPDVVMLAVLPAGYFLYWHAGFILAAVAAVGCWGLYRPWRKRRDQVLLFLNLAAGLMVMVVRIIFFLANVHPDVV